MNAPLSLLRSSKKTITLTAAVFLALALTGCSFFTAAPEKKEQKKAEKIVPPGTISAARIAARKRSGTFICLIADSGKPFASFDPAKRSWQGIEPQIIREIAKHLKMKVQFIRMPARNISAALRNGRGDIAAAKLDTGTIQSLYFLPVAHYAPAAKGNLAFMVRSDDIQWQKDLSAAAASFNINKIVSGNSSTMGSVRIKLADDADKAPPVVPKTDSRKSTDKKAPAPGKTKPPKQEKTKK